MHEKVPVSPDPPLALLGALLDEATDLLAVAEVDGTLRYLNGRARIAWGEGELPATLAQFQPEWAWQTVQSEGLPQALAQGSWTGETALRNAAGAERPVRQTLLRHESGGCTWILCSLRDLTEAKRQEVERMEFMNRYETAFRMSGHVLLDWEPFTGELRCSGDLQGLLGCDPGILGILGGGLPEFRALIHPSDLADFDREVQRTVKTHDSLAVAFRVRQRDGDYRAVRAAGGYYLDRSGRLGRIAAMISDAELLRSMQQEITQLRAQQELSVEEQVRAARRETEEARQARSEFLSRMSHELRTPLNAILGFTQLLELEDPTESQKESIDHIVRAGNHLLSLINEVLDLSRVESGKLSLSIDAVPLVSTLTDMLELVRANAETAGLTLRTDFTAPAGYRVSADPQRLRQVLVNLMTNAVKYNRPGGSVTLRSEAAGEGRVRISIIDTGPGISPEKLERLFIPLEKYRRTAHHGSDVGLGLALSRGIMEAMHGLLGVESTEGIGSTFWIELPLAQDDDQGILNILREEPVVAPVSLSCHTILYVEDEELNQQLVRRVLSDYPEYHLVSTTRGQEALAMARLHRPHLILLDLNLPDMSGEQVLTQFKDSPVLRRIPVIMVTADIVGYRLEGLLAAGATSYLTKPFKIGDLIRIIRDTLASEERRSTAGD